MELGKTYFWCSCGLSSKKPLCDGTHKGTEKRPIAFVKDEKKICLCHKTKTAPYCDGSHAE